MASDTSWFEILGYCVSVAKPGIRGLPEFSIILAGGGEDGTTGRRREGDEKMGECSG